MQKYCDIEVTLRKVTERSYKVSKSNFRYSNNYQASLYNDLITIPRSQVLSIADRPNGRKLFRIPVWLAENEGFEPLTEDAPASEIASQADLDDILKSAAEQLSEVEEIETWGASLSGIPEGTRKFVFEEASRLWLMRTAERGKLLVHPEIRAQLEKQSWKANDLQNRMIWASYLANIEGPDSKERFKSVKIKILKKYGRDWWEDVYKRKTNAWAAKERIAKHSSPVINQLSESTILFGSIARDEAHRALSMIPKI